MVICTVLYTLHFQITINHAYAIKLNLNNEYENPHL